MLIIILLICCVVAAFFVIRYYKGKYIVPIPPPSPGTIKVACVGDSITFGATIKKRKHNCYPAILAQILGDKFSVRNFGANSHGVQKTADYSYWNHKYFELSKKFSPDVVFLLMGSNDTKTFNWKGIDAFEADYIKLVECYQTLTCHPKICLIIPPKMFCVKGIVRYSLHDEYISEISEMLKRLSNRLNLPLVDLYTLTKNSPQLFEFDGVHPHPLGARLIAEELSKTLIELV